MSVSILVLRVSAIDSSVTTCPYCRQKLSRAFLIFKPKEGLTNLIEVVTKAGLTNLIEVVTKAGFTNLIEGVTKAGLTNLIEVVTKAGLTVA